MHANRNQDAGMHEKPRPLVASEFRSCGPRSLTQPQQGLSALSASASLASFIRPRFLFLLSTLIFPGTQCMAASMLVPRNKK